MDSLSVAEVRQYLRMAAEVGASESIVDAHVHGSEIIFRTTTYHPGTAPDVLQAGTAPFRPPQLTGVRLDDPWRAGRHVDAATRNRVSRLHFTAAYQHTGAAVIRAHMQLARVDRALLLPVAPPSGDVEEQMRLLGAICETEERLAVAYSVPNDVPLDEVGNAIERAVARFRVRAVKLHPNLTGIDLQLADGLERVQRILDGARRTGLPVLVHGGRSPILDDAPAAEYATLPNLARVDWSRSGSPVIIAHCGVFGLPREAIVEQALPILRTLMDRHANVLVDTSGLSLPVLVDVLGQLDHQRIVFGSDALYFSMWQAVVILLHALTVAGFPAQDAFARIAARNPGQYLRLAQRSS